MKRFYCTICQKMKRVRKMPLSVQTPNAADPQQRIGTCTRHEIRVYSTRKVAR